MDSKEERGGALDSTLLNFCWVTCAFAGPYTIWARLRAFSLYCLGVAATTDQTIIACNRWHVQLYSLMLQIKAFDSNSLMETIFVVRSPETGLHLSLGLF